MAITARQDAGHGVIDFRHSMVKRPRPAKLHGATYRKDTPLGTAYITVNSDERNEPFEVFMNVGKAGTRGDGRQRGHGAADQPGAAYAGFAAAGRAAALGDG